MKIRLFTTSQATFNRQRWLIKPVGGRAYRPWLISTDSLTARLKSRYTDFRVLPLTQRNAKADLEEVQYLALSSHEHAVIRDVLLYGNNKPVVFAHSILPKRSLRGKWCQLGRLGNKPLGEALFANPQVTRTPLMYKKLTSHHPLYKRAVANLAYSPEYLWARRSVFSLNCAHILVTEVFLPNLLNR